MGTSSSAESSGLSRHKSFRHSRNFLRLRVAFTIPMWIHLVAVKRTNQAIPKGQFMARASDKMVARDPEDPHACVVKLPEAQYGSLDLGKLARVHRLLLDQADEPNAQFLIVDFSAVRWFGARLAGILVDTWDRLRRCNRQL